MKEKALKNSRSDSLLHTSDDASYKEYVRKLLASIAPVIEKVSLGEFDRSIDIPAGTEDEFTELLVGLNMMIEDLRFMFQENKDKTDELERRLTELSAFNEVGRALGSTLKLEEQLKIVYEQTRRVMPADHFYVALYRPESEDGEAELDFVFNIRDGVREPARTRPFANGMSEYIIRSKQPLLVKKDIDRFIEKEGIETTVRGTPAKSWLGVPLMVREEVIGVMTVQSVEKEEAYDEGQKAFFVSLARQASGAIDNARTYMELENRLTELSVLNEIGRATSSTLNIEELYAVIHEQIKRLMNADNFYIAMHDSRRDEVSFPYVIENGKRVASGVGEWITRRAGHGITEYVIRTSKPHMVQGDSKAELAKQGVNHIGKASHSWVGAPMIARNESIGVIALQAFDPQVRYSQKHMRVLQLIANQAAPAVENARAYGMLEQRVTERTAELAKSNEALEDFVYTVSHDLKAPLRAILGFSQFLEEDFGPQLPDEGKMYVMRMSQSAKRMEKLINDLLELSRVGRIKNPYEETNLEELLSEIMTTLSPGSNVEVRIEGPLPNLICDRVRIGQVFANLISNAIKYNDKEKTEITVGFEERQDEVELFVRDNGPGIEERHFDRIFKIFQRLSSDESGTGIGLSLVKKIVEDHKGKVWVESTVGQGSTFRFTLSRNLEANKEA
ncbi:GAF domain-containing protein [bacterium]|nr:GAF domain-containing protein [bacterium]